MPKHPCGTRSACCSPDIESPRLDHWQRWCVFSFSFILPVLLATISACSEPAKPFLCSAEITYDPSDGEEVFRIEVVGDFNDWSTGANPLTLDEEGAYTTTLQLAPGEYLYRLLVNETLILDPLAARLREREGSSSSLLVIEDCRRPRWKVEQAETTSAGVLAVVATFVPGVDGAELDTSTLGATLRDGTEVAKEQSHDDPQVVMARAEGLSPGKHTLILSGHDEEGFEAADLILPLWVVADEPRGPDFSWEGALVYQVIIDRFLPSGEPLDIDLSREEALTARHGGDLNGLTEVVRQGYLEHLGVGALWISPLYDNPDDLWPWYMGLDSSAYHGYWPLSARTVEPMLGGEEAAHSLIEAAHGRGLRVILDVVPNHVHIEHPYYRDHALEWFNSNESGPGECICGSTCSWTEDIERCWFSDYLPDLRWRDPEVAAQLVDDMLFWLEAFDLDGLRIDAISMMPLLATREIVFGVNSRFEVGPVGIHLLGETYTGARDQNSIARALGPFGLDGQFDFPLLWELRRVLARGEGTMDSLDTVIREGEVAWAEVGGGANGQAIMSPFLGNHDVARFISEAAGDDVHHPLESLPERPDEDEPYRRLLLAHTLVLTLPGAPVLYYGDEFGLPGAMDPDNRRPMRFDMALNDREAEMLEAVARLGRLRACLPALRRGARSTLVAEENLYVYLRDVGDSNPAIVVINRGSTASPVSFELPHGSVVDEESILHDALSGTAASMVGGKVEELTLPPLTALVLLTETSMCLHE